jgi:hypothetical protein
MFGVLVGSFLKDFSLLVFLMLISLNNYRIPMLESILQRRIKTEKGLEGEPTINFEDIKPKQNIATTRSFDVMMKTQDELRELFQHLLPSLV